MSSRVGAIAWFLLIVLTLIWGSSFILIRTGLHAFDPITIALLRLSVASLFLLPVATANFHKIQRRDWPRFFAISFVGVGFPALLFPLAQTHVSSVVAGIGNGLSPFWVLVLGALFFRKRFSGLKVLGVLIGFAGAVMLIAAGKSGKDLVLGSGYESLLVVATICYGLSTNIARDLLTRYPAIVVSSFQVSLFGLPALLFLFPATEFLEIVHTQNAASTSLAAIFTLGALGTAFAVILFSRLVQLTDVVFSSSVTYLMPIVAVSWGFVFGENIHWMQLAGMLVILSGVYLVNKGK
jgi:drug/metabolite transporter (DMT)-like permease